LVQNYRLLFCLSIIFCVFASIGSSDTINVEDSIVVTVFGFINEFLERIFVHFTNFEDTTVLISLLDILLVFELDRRLPVKIVVLKQLLRLLEEIASVGDNSVFINIFQMVVGDVCLLACDHISFLFFWLSSCLIVSFSSYTIRLGKSRHS
jgi:hypothetical protein